MMGPSPVVNGACWGAVSPILLNLTIPPTYSSEGNPNCETLLVSPNQRSNRDAETVGGLLENWLVYAQVHTDTDEDPRR